MLVKVIACYDSMLWYKKHIGKTFEVVSEEEAIYWAREGGYFNCLNWIRKLDCEVVDERSVSHQ
jgi:hypothetical protein